MAFFFEANYKLPNEPGAEQEENERQRTRRSIDRRTLYALIESKFQSLVLISFAFLALFDFCIDYISVASKNNDSSPLFMILSESTF